MALSFTVTKDTVSPALGKMAMAAKRPEAVFRAMGTTFLSITQGTFNSVGAAFRPKTWPAKADGSASILQKSGMLAKSFHLDVSAQGATVSNPMVYAAIHQFGGVIEPRAARALSWIGPDGKRIFAMRVIIPARPFFPVDDNGKLIPKAEELVRKAGERAVARQVGEG